MTYDHDVLIRLGGDVEKRKKKLSSAVYGTSHVISRDEAEHIYEAGAQRLIIGAGQDGLVTLSGEADACFKAHGCPIELLPTPDAIQAWNQADDGVIGLFHVTC